MRTSTQMQLVSEHQVPIATTDATVEIEQPQVDMGTTTQPIQPQIDGPTKELGLCIQMDQTEAVGTTTAIDALILQQDEVDFIQAIRGLRARNKYSAVRVLQLETFKVQLLNHGLDTGCNPYALQRQYEGHTLGLFKTTMYVNGNEEDLLAQIPDVE